MRHPAYLSCSTLRHDRMAEDHSHSGQDELKAGSRYLVNPWVSFLREYGPIPQNNNMYDESIQRVTRRTKVQPLQFDTGDRVSRIVADLNADHPRSVLLTGTAGDGKTYLCREAWCSLGANPLTGILTRKSSASEFITARNWLSSRT